MIEIIKAFKVAFMKARNFLVVRSREKRVNWNKKQKMVKIFSKALSNRFQLTSKLISSV